MANPNPQHNPTDGLGTAVAITLRDAAALLTKVGSQVALSPGNRIGGHQYALTMSVAGGANPFIPSSDHLTAVVVDVKGLTFTSGNGNVVKYRAYESPASGANSGKEIVNVTNGSDNGCDIVALNVGQAIVEAYFPFADGVTTVGNPNYGANLPADVISDLGVTSDGDFIYSQVIVTVGV